MIVKAAVECQENKDCYRRKPEWSYEEPTVMCEICSQILKSLETLKSHKNKKAMHENEQFIYTDFGYDKVKIASIGYILSCILVLTYVS